MLPLPAQARAARRARWVAPRPATRTLAWTSSTSNGAALMIKANEVETTDAVVREPECSMGRRVGSMSSISEMDKQDQGHEK
jgi:hypothetical protein